MNPPALLSRRAFLRSTALAALASAGCATPTAKRSDHIDAHVHVWTPDTHRYPLAKGFTIQDKDDVTPSFTPEQLFAQCRPQGVNRVLLIQMSFYHFDNRYLLDSIAANRGAFRGVAIVDETKPDVCETMKALARKGIRGFRVYSDKEKHDGWSRSEGLKKMWSCAADEGLAICLLTDPGALPDVRRICAAYPKTRVVIDHFARIGMKGPIRQHDVDNLRRLSEFERTHVKTSAFYALGAKKPPYMDIAPLIRTLRDSYGASRLMWGSDCPFQLQHHQTYAESISLIRDRLDFLTPSDKEWMLRKTAEKLFFLVKALVWEFFGPVETRTMSTKRRGKLAFADLPRGYSELCGVLPPRPIRDKADFDNVVEVTDAMSLHAEDFSDDQQDYFDMLCSLIQTYEDRQVKWPQGSVRQRLQYLANEHDLTGADISRILGVSRNLGPMILRGDREITAAHARALGAHFGLPAGIFIE